MSAEVSHRPTTEVITTRSSVNKPFLRLVRPVPENVNSASNVIYKRVTPIAVPGPDTKYEKTVELLDEQNRIKDNLAPKRN